MLKTAAPTRPYPDAWRVLPVAVCLGAGGCADQPGLSAWMRDEEVRDVVARELPRGASVAEVESRLDELRVSRERMHYPASGDRPEVLLVRMFRGGFWLDTDDDFIDWLDLSLVFEPTGFDRAVLYRDRVRYYCGDPVNPPRRAAAGPMRRYPGRIPPPADPLEGAQ